MVVYEEKVDELIADLEAKDVQQIVDDNIYIPTLGKTNTVSQVQNWIDKRIGYLEQAKILSETQLQTFVDNYYNSLTVNEQLIADAIMAGEELPVMTEEEWENTVLFSIYLFITTPTIQIGGLNSS